MSATLEHPPRHTAAGPEHGASAPAADPNSSPESGIDSALNLVFAFSPNSTPRDGACGEHAKPMTIEQQNASFEKRFEKIDKGFIATICNWWSGGKRDAAHEALLDWKDEYQRDKQSGLLNNPEAKARLAEKGEDLEKALKAIENRKQITEMGVKALGVTALTIAATMVAAPVVAGALTAAGITGLTASIIGGVSTAGLASFASRAGFSYVLGGFKYSGAQAVEDAKMATLDGLCMGGSAVLANMAVGHAVRIFGQSFGTPILGNAIGRFSVAVAEGTLAGAVGAGTQVSAMTAADQTTWKDGVDVGLQRTVQNGLQAAETGAVFGAVGGAIAGLGRLRAPKAAAATAEAPADAVPESTTAPKEITAPKAAVELPATSEPTSAPELTAKPTSTSEQVHAQQVLEARANASDAIADIAQPTDPKAAKAMQDEATRLRSLSELLDDPRSMPAKPSVPKIDLQAQGAQLDDTLSRMGGPKQQIEYLEQVVAGNRDPIRIDDIKARLPQQALDNHEAFTKLAEERLVALRAQRPVASALEPAAVAPLEGQPVVTKPSPAEVITPEQHLDKLNRQLSALNEQGRLDGTGGPDAIQRARQRLVLERQIAVAQEFVVPEAPKVKPIKLNTPTESGIEGTGLDAGGDAAIGGSEHGSSWWNGSGGSGRPTTSPRPGGGGGSSRPSTATQQQSGLTVGGGRSAVATQPGSMDGPIARLSGSDSGAAAPRAQLDTGTAVLDAPEIAPPNTEVSTLPGANDIDELFSSAQKQPSVEDLVRRTTSSSPKAPEAQLHYDEPRRISAEPEPMRQLAPKPKPRAQVAVAERPTWSREMEDVFAETERQRTARLQALFDAPAPEAAVAQKVVVEADAAPIAATPKVSTATAADDLVYTDPEIAPTEPETKPLAKTAAVTKVAAPAAEPEEAVAVRTQTVTKYEPEVEKVSKLAQKLARMSLLRTRRPWDTDDTDFEPAEIEERHRAKLLEEQTKLLKPVNQRFRTRAVKRSTEELNGIMAKSDEVIQRRDKDGKVIETIVVPNDEAEESRVKAAFGDNSEDFSDKEEG